MATGNFYNKNASKIFAIGIGADEDNDFLFDDIKYALNEDFVKLEKNTVGLCYYRGVGKDPDQYSNQFCATVIGTLSMSKTYKDFEAGVELVAVVRSGYYEGANLDFTTRFMLDGDEVDLDYFQEQIEWLTRSEKMAEYKAPLATKWVEKAKDELVELVEAIYEKISQPLTVKARFSNGETIYEKA